MGAMMPDQSAFIQKLEQAARGGWAGIDNPDGLIDEGQKRAEAVRRSMASLGVAESQMEAVSLGEEKPKAMGSGESAWAENRRADIVY